MYGSHCSGRVTRDVTKENEIIPYLQLTLFLKSRKRDISPRNLLRWLVQLCFYFFSFQILTNVRTIHARTELPVSTFREATAVTANLDTVEATVKQVRYYIRSIYLTSLNENDVNCGNTNEMSM